MQFIPYLGFNGNCREALEFYAKVLHAELELMEFGGSPAEQHVPAEAKNQILHGNLTLKGTSILMASDAGGMPYEKMQGMSVAIVLDDTDEAERIFKELSEGGNVTMPMEPTFWAKRFGMGTDLYGTPWMINSGMPEEAAAKA